MKCENCTNDCAENESFCKSCLEFGEHNCLSCSYSLSGFESMYCYNCSMDEIVNSADYTSNEIEMLESMGYTLDEIQSELLKNTHVNQGELNNYLLEKGYKEPVREITLILGASKGVGSAVMVDLQLDGEFVVSVSRSVPEVITEALKGNSHVNVIKEEDKEIFTCYSGGELFHIHICGDFSEEKVVSDIEFTLNKYNLKICNLISCHGIIKGGGVESETIVDFREVMEVNVSSNYNIILNLYPYMLDVKGANIILISSISSERAGSSISYSVSKAALDMLVKSLALDLSKHGIRVNGINPGLISTGFQLNNEIFYTDEDYINFLKSQSENNYPLGRVGNTHDIIGLLKYLLSATWATGVNYVLDGGRLLK